MRNVTRSFKGAWIATVLIVTMMTLSACAAPKATEKEQQLDELTVLLDWYPNAVHSFLFAAESQGYFEEAGLHVKLQTPADTNDAIKLVAAGKADLAISYQMQVAISRGEDIPIVSVAALVRHPLNQLFILDDKKVERPMDLAELKIGYPSIPLYESFVKTMFAHDGGDPSQLTFVDIGWDLIPAMTTGRVDAIIGGYVNHEKLLLEKEDVKLKTFIPSEYGVPDYYELVLTASEKGIEQKGDVFKRFIEAATRGFEYTMEHPSEALQYLLDKQSDNFPLDAEIEQQSLAILLPLMDAGTEAFGKQSEQSWQHAIDWLVEQGQLKKDIEAKDAFRNL